MNFLRNLLDGIRNEKERQRRKDAAMRRKLSPRQYQRYLAKQKQKRRKVMLARLIFLAVIVVIVILVIVAIGKAVSGYRSNKTSEPAQEELSVSAEEESAASQEKDIVIGSTGCMIMHQAILDSYKIEKSDGTVTYDFSDIFQYVIDDYSAPDYMTCEMEGVFADSPDDCTGYPTLVGSDVMADNLFESGVDLQLLATNHVYDDGTEGVSRTMDYYEEKGIDYTGVRQEEDDDPYYIADIDGIKVGFLNYVSAFNDGTNYVLNMNTLTSEDSERVNCFDVNDPSAFYTEVKSSISAMKEEGVQFIIADLHWGDEYQLKENADQDEMAQELCDLGVNALIGGHPHCEEPIDVLKSSDGDNQMFCIYSVGNALSNQTADRMESELAGGYTEDGVIINMTLHQDSDGNVTLAGVDAIPTWMHKNLTNEYDDTGEFYILPLDDVDNIEEETGLTGIKEDAQASYDRTMEVIGDGLKKAQEAFGGGTE